MNNMCPTVHFCHTLTDFISEVELLCLHCRCRCSVVIKGGCSILSSFSHISSYSTFPPKFALTSPPGNKCNQNFERAEWSQFMVDYFFVNLVAVASTV